VDDDVVLTDPWLDLRSAEETWATHARAVEQKREQPPWPNHTVFNSARVVEPALALD